MTITVAALVEGLTRLQSVRQQARVPRRIAARHEGPMRRILTRAFHRVRRPISPEQVYTAIRFSSPDMLLAALFPVTGQWMLALGGLTAHLRDVYFESYQASETQMLRLTGAQFSLPPNAYADAIAWAESYAAALVSGITEEGRTAIRILVARAFQEGIPPRALGRLILEATTLGLTPRGVHAVLNARVALSTAPEGRAVRIGPRVLTAPRGGFAAEQVEQITHRYAQRLLGQRALTIARTETIQAARVGQQALWSRAVQDGRLRTGTLQRWSAAPDERTCPICTDLDGRQTPLGGSFATITGAALAGPPAHPNCRCSLVLDPQ